MTKSLILQCRFGSRAQKLPNIARKKGSVNRDLLIFLYRYGIFLVLLVNPHVQAVQNMCGTGG